MPVLDSEGTLSVDPARRIVGAAPYSATGGSNCCEAISHVAYFPANGRQRAAAAHRAVGAPHVDLVLAFIEK